MNKKMGYPQILAISNIHESLYFQPYNSPGTFIIEKGSDHLRLIPEIDRPHEWHDGVYSDCIRYKNLLVFVPYLNAKFISILDTQSLKFSYVENVGGYRYKKGIVYENGIYMFGESLDGGKRMMLDMDSMSVKNVVWKGENVSPTIMFDSGCRIDNKVYWSNWGSGTVCNFDFENKNAEKIVIKNVNMPILTITFDGEYFWLSGIGDEILIWDEKKNEIVETIQLEKAREKRLWEMRFSSSKILGEYVYFSPVNYDKMIRIHRKSKKIEELFEIEKNEACWNICEMGCDRFYVDVTNYKDGSSRNYTISEDGTIKDNNTEFSIQDYYFKENIYERPSNTLEMFINYLTSVHV